MSNSAAKRGRPRILTDEQRKARTSQYNAKYWSNNRERLRVIRASYYLANREALLAKAAAYRARKRAEGA